MKPAVVAEKPMASGCVASTACTASSSGSGWAKKSRMVAGKPARSATAASMSRPWGGMMLAMETMSFVPEIQFSPWGWTKVIRLAWTIVKCHSEQPPSRNVRLRVDGQKYSPVSGLSEGLLACSLEGEEGVVDAGWTIPEVLERACEPRAGSEEVVALHLGQERAALFLLEPQKHDLLGRPPRRQEEAGLPREVPRIDPQLDPGVAALRRPGGEIDHSAPVPALLFFLGTHRRLVVVSGPEAGDLSKRRRAHDPLVRADGNRVSIGQDQPHLLAHDQDLSTDLLPLCEDEQGPVAPLHVEVALVGAARHTADPLRLADGDDRLRIGLSDGVHLPEPGPDLFGGRRRQGADECQDEGDRERERAPLRHA